MGKFKVIIAGGRDFDDFDALIKVCDKVLANKDEIEIVSGCALGADRLGERYARMKGYPIKEFPAPWGEVEGKPDHEIGVTKTGNKYWKLAGPVRNSRMADYADALIAFWDGESTGTKDMINKAEGKGLPTKVKHYRRVIKTLKK